MQKNIMVLMALCVTLLTSAASAESITINARNWGPDSLAADQAMEAKAAAFVRLFPDAYTVSWLARYTYNNINDSTVWVDDWGQADPKPIRRAFIPSNPEQELPVSPIWCIVTKVVDTVEVVVGDAGTLRALHAAPPEKKTVVRKGKVTTSYATFSTWLGGPEPTKVGPLDAATRARLKANIAKMRAKVDALEADGYTWRKNGVTLTKAKKRVACWRVAKGLDKASDYTKTKSKGGAR